MEDSPKRPRKVMQGNAITSLEKDRPDARNLKLLTLP